MPTVTSRALFTEPLIEQLVALIYRDQLPWLTFFGETEPFQEFDLAPLYPANFPKVSVYETQVDIDGNHFDTIPELIHINVDYVVAHQDRNILSRKYRNYGAALYNLLWAIEIGDNGADFYTSLPLPENLAQIGASTVGVQLPTMVNRIYVSRFRLLQLGTFQGRGFAMEGRMEMEVMVEEQV